MQDDLFSVGKKTQL